MAELEFAQLLELYRHIAFDQQGDEGVLSIATPDMLATLRWLESDDAAAADGGLAAVGDSAALDVGQTVRVRVSAPKVRLGILARDFDQLLAAPQARMQEPKAFFVVDGALEKDMPAPRARLLAYRAALAIVGLLAKAAAYVDEPRAKLVIGKLVVPVQYDAAALDRLSLDAARQLQRLFSDSTHEDQKCEILSEAVVRTCRVQPEQDRFIFLLDNMQAVADAACDNYQLFASNFSYDKIRSEIENARIEYVTRIHKTVVDIQGQLLGIPVATVIVASQLKVARACSLELWGDVAIAGGAWIFFVLLAIAIFNQWLTLGTIKQEIERQQAKLADVYAAISGQFADVFKSLGWRIYWHRCGLVIVALIGAAGAAFASVAVSKMVQVDVSDCLFGRVPVVDQNKL